MGQRLRGGLGDPASASLLGRSFRSWLLWSPGVCLALSGLLSGPQRRFSVTFSDIELKK